MAEVQRAAPAIWGFERYLTVWVLMCIVVGIVVGTVLGKVWPHAFAALGGIEVAHVNLPVAVLVWLMIVPMLLRIDWRAMSRVGRHWKGMGVTLAINWLVKPFSMAALAWVFLRHVFADALPADQLDSYVAGLILLAAARAPPWCLCGATCAAASPPLR